MVYTIHSQPSAFSAGYVKGSHEADAPCLLPPMPERRAPPLCRHWQRGYCAAGENCSFSHSDEARARGAPVMINGQPSDRMPTAEELREHDMFVVVKSSEACKDFQAGKCTRGDKCKFAHVGTGRNFNSKQIQCRDFLAGKCTRGDTCKYRHGPAMFDMQDMGEDPVLCQPCPPAPMPPVEVAPKVYRIVSAPQPAPQPVRIVRYVTTTRVQPPPPPYGMQELYSPQQGWEREPGWEAAPPAGTPVSPPQGCWDTTEPQMPSYQQESGVDTLRQRLMQVEAEAARLQAEADAAEANAAALRANVAPPPPESARSEEKSEDTSPTPPYVGDVSETSQRSVSPVDGAVAPRYVRHDPYAL